MKIRGWSDFWQDRIWRAIALVLGVMLLLLAALDWLVVDEKNRVLVLGISALIAGLIFLIAVLTARMFIAHRALRKVRDELAVRLHEQTWEMTARNELLELNIVERERAEHALAHSNAELEQFAYVASHDLQEPLRMVVSYLQLLAQRYQDKLDSDAKEFIGYAVDGGKRMQVLINDLLAYSRVGTKGKPFKPTDCEAMLAKVLMNLRVAITEAAAQITHDPLPTISGDETQLAQLFQNLIANAIKFRGDGPPQVHIHAEAQDDLWHFTIRDNGIGIAPEYFERIFILFQRLHSRTAYQGTGIGLAVCKKIVERHGGRIWVESAPQKGSIFNFTVPAKKGAEP